MVNVVRESVADVDCVLLLVEPIASIGPQEEALISRIEEQDLPAILVINKIDTVEKERLLEVMAVYSARHTFDAIIPPVPARGWKICRRKWKNMPQKVPTSSRTT